MAYVHPHIVNQSESAAGNKSLIIRTKLIGQCLFQGGRTGGALVCAPVIERLE